MHRGHLYGGYAWCVVFGGGGLLVLRTCDCLHPPRIPRAGRSVLRRPISVVRLEVWGSGFLKTLQMMVDRPTLVARRAARAAVKAAMENAHLFILERAKNAGSDSEPELVL